MHYTRLLTIAGSDSGGGAGIQADLKTFAALGGYGMSVITSVTAQNTLGICGIHDIPPDFVARQMDAVLSDIGADAVKIGMLSSPEIIDVVADRLTHHRVRNIVLDPVMVATSGDRLCPDAAVQALRERLFPLAEIITPNMPEAEMLLGIPIHSDDDLERAAQLLLEHGPAGVLLKGGHGKGERSDDGFAHRTPDGTQFHWIPGKRIATKNTHGTGCTLSSAIAAYLGLGRKRLDAVRAAKHYVIQAIEAGAAYSLGKGNGPVHHGW